MSFDSLSLQVHAVLLSVTINDWIATITPDVLPEDQTEHGRTVLMAFAEWVRAVAEDPESNDARFHQARVTTLATLHKGLYISR